MNPYAYGKMNTYGVVDLSFLEYGVPNEYILEALANQYNYSSSSNNNNNNNNNKRSKSPPKHRHDGTSPLPLGIDWSPPPRSWDGCNTVWPHDPCTGWSYCVTVPSWTIMSDSKGSGSVVFYRVQVGVQTPEAITTSRGILRRFSDFLNLFSELKKLFPKKNLPLPPPRKLLGTKSQSLTEERRTSLEDWMEKLLSDIDISRSAPVAIFLELEAAVRSSFSDQSGDDISSLRVHQSGSDISLTADGSSVISDNINDTGLEKSEIKTPSLGDLAEDRLFEGIVRATSCDKDKKCILSEGEDDKVTAQAPSLSVDSAGSDISSIRASGTSTQGSTNTYGEGAFDFSGGTEGSVHDDLQLPSNLVMALPSEQRHKFSRVLVTMEERLTNAKADMEDLVARLNQENAVRQFLTTKVTDLEVELETTKESAKENLQQAISTEKERCTQMQWDLEEFRKRCLELEMKLKEEQEEKARIVSENVAVIQDNEMLKQELHTTREQLENLQKQHEEAEMKSKTDVKVLVKEVKSLRSSQLELKQELSKTIKEKLEVEKDLQNEKQRMEHTNNVNEKLLHECAILQKRLQDCSVNFLVDQEEKLTLDTPSSSDAIDLLSTSDNRIGLLLAEAQLLAQDIESSGTTADSTTEDKLRKMVTDVFIDNATLRKQINAVVRCTIKTDDKTEEDDGEKAPSRETVLGKYL